MGELIDGEGFDIWITDLKPDIRRGSITSIIE